MIRIPGMRGRRLESADKAKKELGLTLLAELPSPIGGVGRLETAYTHLLQETLLRVAQGETQRTTIAVTSTHEREGRTSVAANLAIAAARLGRSVLLVDTDVRNPQLHRIFGGDFAPVAPGLVDLLAGGVSSPSEVLLDTTVPGVRLLPVGDVDLNNTADLFSSTRLERFVRSIAPRLADIVIFDSPPVRSNEPGRHVLTHVDGVLFTVGLGETETSAARKALETLERNQVAVVGGIFLTPGDFPLSMTVPLPELTLQKQDKDAEILGGDAPGVAGEPIKVMPTVSLDDPQASENEADGLSMNVATASKKDDDNGAVPAGGFGVEDLEAVLQGWRRRDGASVPEATETAEASASYPIPLPTMFEAPTVSAGKDDVPAGVAFPMGDIAGEGVGTPISMPFLSVTTNQDKPEESQDAKPVLTLVESTMADSDSGEEQEQQKEAPEVAVLVAPVEEVEEVLRVEEVVPSNVIETTFAPVIPVFPVPVMAADAPEPTPAPSVPVVSEPVVLAPVAAWPVVAPVVAAPVVAAPVVAPEPPSAPVFQAAPFQPVPAFVPMAAPAPAPVATAPVALATGNRAALDMQIDMFQTGPGEMTMRAATSNASAVGVPPISLELAMAMTAMRGMRAITPSSMGGADQPRIALEAVSTDAPEATRMRMIVGSTHEPALEVVIHNGAGISVRTGSGMEQPAVKLDSQNLPDGGTITRATLLPARGGQELVLELRREPVNDGFTDARWRNRLSLFA